MILGAWQKNSIDYVDDAIRAFEVCRSDMRAVDGHAVIGRDMEVFAGHGSQLHGACNIGGRHLAGNHMQCQDRSQFGLVLGLHQLFHGACGELGKGVMRRGKHGKWTGVLERCTQIGSSNECFERTRGNGGIHDIVHGNSFKEPTAETCSDFGSTNHSIKKRSI